MKRFSHVGACLLAMSAPRAAAATVVAVSQEHQRATLELTDEELPQVRKGVRLVLTLGKDAAPLNVEVLKVKGKRAQVLILKAEPAATAPAPAAANGAVTPGSRVQLASAAPLIMVKPTPSPTDAAQEAVPGAAPSGIGLFHPSQVNPAQIRRVRSLYAEASMSLVSDEFHARGDGAEAAVSLRGPMMRAATVLTDDELGMQLGLIVQSEELNGRIRFDVDEIDEDEQLKVSESVIGPVFGVRLPAAFGGQWFAGLAYKVVQRRFDGPYYEASHSLAFTRVQPGVLFATPVLEAGVTFEPKVMVESSSGAAPGIGGATVRVAEPARLTGHARLARRQDLAVYGSLTSNQNRMLNADGESGWKNNFLLVGGAEKRLTGGVVIDGALLFYTPAYAGEADLTVDNMARYGLNANYARAYSDAVAIQAGVLLMTGDDSYSDPDIGRVSLGRDTIRLTGGATYKF